jgi:hypothetical protein
MCCLADMRGTKCTLQVCSVVCAQICQVQCPLKSNNPEAHVCSMTPVQTALYGSNRSKQAQSSHQSFHWPPSCFLQMLHEAALTLTSFVPRAPTRCANAMLICYSQP